MVVFAHPDDAELGAGAVVAVWSGRGCELTYVLCTTGSSGSDDRSMGSDRLVQIRQAEQRAAAAALGVRHLEFLDHPDGGLEDDVALRGEIVRLIRKYRPVAVLCHDPHHIRGFQHRDHRIVGTVVLDAIYPYARDHLHFPEHIEKEGLQPHKVREALLWGADEPNIVIDITDGIDAQIEGLRQHESQIDGLAGGRGVFDRLRKRAEQTAEGYPFRYGQRFRRLIARS